MEFNHDMRMGCASVLSISALCDEQMARYIRQSDYIRRETFRRCRAIASYDSKPLRWKNRYYDYFRKKVLRELGET